MGYGINLIEEKMGFGRKRTKKADAIQLKRFAKEKREAQERQRLRRRERMRERRRSRRSAPILNPNPNPNSDPNNEPQYSQNVDSGSPIVIRAPSPPRR